MLQKDIDNWFITKVLPLEAKLMAFLVNHYSDLDVSDLRQEIYARVYRAAQSGLPEHTQAFVFKTARNLVFDLIRRKKVISIESIADFESAQLDFEEPNVEDSFYSRRELRALRNALERLPKRCKQVFELRKILGHSQKEVSEQLKISESTVEKHIAKGINLLANALYSQGRPFSDNLDYRGKVIKILNEKQ